eukprot:COSAG01_NODE_34841_length_541_cov_0.841629_1_plen_43_part_10
MVLEAVKQNGLALGGALALLQADRELVLAVMAQEGYALKHASA